ncbi:FAD-binding and (Fe-S)-binding domain-containing protein [Campylobacter gastrosuis]|uniref:D-lactate dehydrogenase (cytochrome) n=1 Tax=Campylobacter gastrosuis TaxID=2974576 RepID=A0ABT7HRH2_9BACT|nr:FAD-binding and (Fe-S)-binding domain-containing protein [Campylobacter gastrosuis]MDL0089506.1 FAD-binding oxidoreductase [Campylobacter gastrosuis]
MKWSEDYANFIKEANKICPNRVFESYLLRYAYGIDASCYNYTPRVVVKAVNEDEIISLLKIATKYETPVTFRAAGSSLSGQCSSDKVLIIANDGFKGIKINDDASVIELDCGVIASEANNALKPFSKKIGPDPATITTALIGGILNNNSSGMCCGVAQNSYNTIHSIRAILLDGTIIDTASDESVESFLNTHKHIANGLFKLRDEILADDELVSLIKRKYKIKNTTGYSINSLLDFSDIRDIINHIFVGSEGTLGFVSKVRYFAVDDFKFKGCGLLFYDDLAQASKAVVKLANLGRDVVVAAEMMDYACLNATKEIEGVPSIIKECKEGYTAILIQSESENEAKLNENLERIKAELSDISMPLTPLYSTDEAEFSSWWRIRKGILPIVAGARKQGTTIVTEDICFTIEKFCDGVAYLQELFKKHNFEGVIFGHALSGNLHFNITPDFNDPKEYENFSNLVKDMSNDVPNMGGSAKAEHGTGRMVAPFVEVEWGKKAYAINRAIKNLFDEKRLINPDVIISDDPEIYKKNLKAMPKNLFNIPDNTEIINRCMECGFCEKHCPSKNLTLTPRQRIAVLREISRLLAQNENDKANELLTQYEYYGISTCATCGECFELCPLGINTANIATELRKAISDKTLNTATKIYNNFANVTKIAKFGLNLYGFGSAIIGEKGVSNLTKTIRNFSVNIPFTPPFMPRSNDFKFSDKLGFSDKVVYFSACTNRMFKPNAKMSDKRNIQEVFESVCKKAKFSVIYPKSLEKMCCGKMFVDYENILKTNREFLKSELLNASQNGKYPVVVDHSSCFYQTAKTLENEGLRILDISEFLFEISSRLSFKVLDKSVLIHKLCLLKRAKKADFIEKLAKMCVKKADVIKSFECCGFAGNKGFFTPELNQSSTRDLKFEAQNYDFGVSTSGTCEIGLNAYGGIEFKNIVYLVNEATL